MTQRFLVLLLVAGVPLIYSSSTLDPNVLPRFTIAYALICLFGISLFVRKADRNAFFDLPRSSLWILGGLGLYSLIAAVSIFYATNSAEAIYETARSLLALSVLVVLIITLASDENLLLLLARAITVVVILDVFVGSFQSFGLGFEFIPGGVIPRGFNGQQNQFASFLLLASPFAGYLILKDKPAWRLIAIAALLLSLFGFVISHSRGVWLVMIITLLIALIIIKYRRRSLKLFIISFTILITLLFIGLLYNSSLILDAMWRSHDIYRYNVWAKTLHMIADHPLLGVGAGNWKIIFPAYGLQEFGGLFAEGWTTWVRPHNEGLATLAETGPIGLIGMLLFFGSTLTLFWKRLFAGGESTVDKPVLLFFSGILIYLGYTLFSFERERVEHLILLILLIAAGLYSRKLTTVSGKTIRIPLRFVSIGLIVTGLLGSALGAVRWNAEIHTRRAAVARLEQDWKRLAAEASLAQSFFYSVDPTAVPVAWYGGVGLWMQGDVPAAESAFREALRHHPNHLHALINLASCCAKTGENDEAGRHYEKALSISPQYIETRLNYAAFLANAGSYEWALEVLKGYKNQDDPQIQQTTLQINRMKERLQ